QVSSIMSTEYPQQEDTPILLAEFNKFLGFTLVAQLLKMLHSPVVRFSYGNRED
ncbi:unnamed protein product, partial [marine sediment metagenome]